MSPVIVAAVAAAAIGLCVAACSAENKNDDIDIVFDELTIEQVSDIEVTEAESDDKYDIASDTTKSDDTINVQETTKPETEKLPETTRIPETTKVPETQNIPDTTAVILIKRSDSSMTRERILELENVAVFWAPTGKKMHLDPDCKSFKLGFTFAGTLEEAKSARDGGWCGICSKGMTDEKYLSNYKATAERLADCYTYEDFSNKIPAEAFK